MDINSLFEFGMIKCGRVLKILPESEIESPNIYMKTTLEIFTLPSLNELYPYIYTALIPCSELIKTNEKQDGYEVFRIPPEFTKDLEIFGIKSVEIASHDGGGINGNNSLCINHGLYTNKYGRASSASIYEMATASHMAYADQMLLSQFRTPFKFRFFEPNILWLSKNHLNNETQLSITFRLENDPNLITLPNEANEAIRNLFVLDLKTRI